MRDRERGSAMLVTLILVTALLAGAVVLAAMQLNSTRASDVSRTSMSATYCAEAGLAAARPVVLANFATAVSSLYTSGTLTEPSFLQTGITTAGHDLDGDGVADFLVYLKDNDDEIGTNNPAVDSDLRIFIVSRCLKYGETVKEVEELVQFSGGGQCYQSQLGGCAGNGNAN